MLDIHDITKFVVETARAAGETDISQDKDWPLSVATSQVGTGHCCHSIRFKLTNNEVVVTSLDN